MKINKSILAVVLGLSVASLQAGDVFMSGSTAMRGTIYNALMAPGVVFSAAPTFTGYGGKGSGDTYMAFSGTLVGGSGTTVVKCYWSGSEAGIQDLALGNSETFIADGALNGVDNSGTPSGSSAQTSTVNLSMADNAQTYSRTKTPALTGVEVGIVTFKWIRNPGLWAGTNVTDSQIRQAMSGACPLAVFSGNAGDTNSFVYVAGRDTSSGTRVNTLGDTDYGILTPVNQIQVTGGIMVNQGTVGSPVYISSTGYSSGGSLAGAVESSTTSSEDYVNTTYSGATINGFSVIAYLGYNDAKTALTASGSGAVECSYNGVPFSPANIENGTYTFWGNEYLYKANSVTSSATPEAYTVYTSLGSIGHGLDTIFDGVSAIPLDAMHTSRVGPTADPGHY